MQRGWHLRVIFSFLELVVLGSIATRDSWTHHPNVLKAFTPVCAEEEEIHDQLNSVVQGSLRVNLSNYCVHPSQFRNESYIFQSRTAVPPSPLDGGWNSEIFHGHRITGGHEAAYTNGMRIPVNSVSKFETRGSSSSFSFPVVQGKGLYRAEIHVGTPSQKLLLELDTGSDLTWIKCRPSVLFGDSLGEYGNNLFFDSHNSSTFETFDAHYLVDPGPGKTFSTNCFSRSTQPICNFIQKYADGTFAVGCLVTETITDGSKQLPLALGCESSSFGDFETGILGLGRGSLSLPSQIGGNYSHRFAYCLSSDTRYRSGFLTFGDAASPKVSGMKFLSLIQNPRHPSFYYLTLESLSVGGEQLQFPNKIFSIDQDTGSGGVLLDSGTTYTMLPTEVYEKLVKALESKIPLPRAPPSTKLALCFNTSEENSSAVLFPKLILHFREDEELVSIELPSENYFKQVTPEKVCLAALPSQKPAPAIIGNLWHRNFHILIDTRNNSVGFLGPKVCIEDDQRYDSVGYQFDLNIYNLSFVPFVLALPACLLSIFLLSLVPRVINR